MAEVEGFLTVGGMYEGGPRVYSDCAALMPGGSLSRGIVLSA